MKDLIINKYNNYKITIDSMDEEEFEILLIKFGSYISMLNNKQIKPAAFISIVLDYIEYQNIMCELMGETSFYNLIKKILLKYPNLCRSKIIKRKIRKFKRDYDRKRKINI